MSERDPMTARGASAGRPDGNNEADPYDALSPDDAQSAHQATLAQHRKAQLAKVNIEPQKMLTSMLTTIRETVRICWENAFDPAYGFLQAGVGGGIPLKADDADHADETLPETFILAPGPTLLGSACELALHLGPQFTHAAATLTLQDALPQFQQQTLSALHQRRQDIAIRQREAPLRQANTYTRQDRRQRAAEDMRLAMRTSSEQTLSAVAALRNKVKAAPSAPTAEFISDAQNMMTHQPAARYLGDKIGGCWPLPGIAATPFPLKAKQIDRRAVETAAAKLRLSSLSPNNPLLREFDKSLSHTIQSIENSQDVTRSTAQDIQPLLQLAPNWIEKLDVQRFNDIAFLQACDESVDPSLSLQTRLKALYRVLKPTLTQQRSALSIDGFDAKNMAIFFHMLLPALGLGSVPEQGLDPAFKQTLFEGWFLSLASPLNVDNGGPDQFPLHGLLLRLIHGMPATATGATCANGPALMRLDQLKEKIIWSFLLESPEQPRVVQEWIIAGLFSAFEPTLVRPDLPPALRYGSLEWALLDIGIRLAGPQHWQYSHQELVGLAIASDVFRVAMKKPGDNANELAMLAVGTVLRMAHAEDKIDLLDPAADPSTRLEIAITLFLQRLDAQQQLRSDTITTGGLPVRKDIANTMLREYGLNPKQQFTLFKPKGRYGKSLLETHAKDLHCLALDTPHALVDIFMARCMTQLYTYGQLPASTLKTLGEKMAMLSHASLDLRFGRAFDAAWNAFSDNLFSSMLDTSLSAMAETDTQFWHCGKATVRIPDASILTRIPARPNMEGAIGVGRAITSQLIDYRGTGGLFVHITLEENGRAEARDYWVTLDPIMVRRFDGDDASLLMGKLDAFFKTTHPDYHLLKMNPHAKIGYRTSNNDVGQRSIVQFVSRLLLAPRLAQAREIAFQKTAPELSRENANQWLFQLLPFYDCIQSTTRSAYYQAAFSCLVDVLSLIPLMGAGTRLAGSVARAGATASRGHIKKLALSLLKNSAEREVALTVLQVGVPAHAFAQQMVHWINPLNGVSSGLSWMATRIGKHQLLRQRLKKIPALHRITADIETFIANQKLFYPQQGFWVAAPDAIILKNGQRQIQVAEKTLLVIDMDAQRNVLAIQNGQDLRLVNPESGLPYGPPLSKPDLDASNKGIATRNTLPGICRTKRGDTEGDCNVLIPAGNFGQNVYRLRDRKTFYVVQAGPQKKDGGVDLLEVDWGVAGFSSYSRQAGITRYHDRYFVFDQRVWIAKNGHLQPTSIACGLPETIRASFTYPDGHEGSGPGYLSLVIRLPPIHGDPHIYFNRMIVPYGNYPGDNGMCMGLVEVGKRPYTFSFPKEWGDRPLPGKKITLEIAGPAEQSIFVAYRNINMHKRRPPDAFVVGSLRQLRVLSSTRQRRFDAVLLRTETILNDASHAFKARTPAVNSILKKFMPASWSALHKQEFIATLGKNLDKMRSGLDVLKNDKLDVIGIGVAIRTKTVNPVSGKITPQYVFAESYEGTMTLDMHFSHVNKALITFDEEHFDLALIDTLVADLVHELSHTRLGTYDTISGTSKDIIYASRSTLIPGGINVRPLIVAAGTSGSDTAKHASTFEQLVITMAYTRCDDTLKLILGFLHGGNTYTHRADPITATATCVISR